MSDYLMDDDELDEMFEGLRGMLREEASLRGKTIVITGKLQNYKRVEIQRAIEKKGGKSPNSVTLDTVALVVGEKPGMTKLRRAVELGLPILSEAQLMNMMLES